MLYKQIDISRVFFTFSVSQETVLFIMEEGEEPYLVGGIIMSPISISTLSRSAVVNIRQVSKSVQYSTFETRTKFKLQEEFSQGPGVHRLLRRLELPGVLPVSPTKDARETD